MAELFMKLAAVNFDATVGDSNDLSVIRGSSALLLEIVPGLAAALQRSFVTEGASILYAAASEFVIRFDLPPASSGARQPRGQPDRMKRQVWLDLCRKVAGTVEDEADLGAAAQRLFTELLTDEHQRGWTPAKTCEHLRYHWAQLRPEADPAGRMQARIESEVARLVAAEPKARWFTLAYGFCRDDGLDLRGIMRLLDNRLRTRQLQQLTVVLPEPAATLRASEGAFCAFTLGRQPAQGDQDGRPISMSAAARRRDGRASKTDLYLTQIGIAKDAAAAIGDDAAAVRLGEAHAALTHQPFLLARSFEDIVGSPPPRLPPNVRGKLAVIHLDGNNFGKQREQAMLVGQRREAREHYARLSKALLRNSGLMLVELLQWLLDQPEGWTWQNEGGDRRLCFETLLFGGDEMCFVLPAWTGWSFMGRLVAVSSELTAPWRPGTRQPLSYGIGMVLADSRSPIRELRRAAGKLAEAAKEASRTCSMVQVKALEGLDQAELDPGILRKWLFPTASRDPGAFALDGKSWPTITANMQAIGRDVGRSQLHDFYQAAESRGLFAKPSGDPEVTDWLERMQARLGDFPKANAHVADLCASTLLAHGAERWPYLPLHHVLTLADYVQVPPAAGELGT